MYIYHFIDNLFQSIVMGNRYSFGQWEVIRYIHIETTLLWKK